MCGGHEMCRGRHYATFTLGDTWTFVGVVAAAGFDPANGDEANESSVGWVMFAYDGTLRHNHNIYHWLGQPSANDRQTESNEGVLTADDVVVWLPRPCPSRHSAQCCRAVLSIVPRRACCLISTQRP